MAVGRAYEHAVVLLKENPGLDIGIHLCLTEEEPIVSEGGSNSLTGEDGCFLRPHREIFLRYFMGKLNLDNVRKELDAQIRKVLGSGINITHIDSHGHIHILPEILNIVMELADRYHIPFIRYPCEWLRTLDVNFSRRIQNFIFNILCVYSKRRFKNYNIAFFGFLHSGHISERSLTELFVAVNDGVTEIVCHPGIYDQGLERYRHWGYQWEEELQVLVSEDIKKKIKDFNIEVVSFRDIL